MDTIDKRQSIIIQSCIHATSIPIVQVKIYSGTINYIELQVLPLYNLRLSVKINLNFIMYKSIKYAFYIP